MKTLTKASGHSGKAKPVLAVGPRWTTLLANLFRSSLGKKYLMAVTGCVLFLFVVGHMVGNLQIFLGPEAINRYGHFLQTNPEMLWPARLGLLADGGAARLVGDPSCRWRTGRRARWATRDIEPVGASLRLAHDADERADRRSCFIIYHLLHYTVQVQAINLTGQDFVDF